MFENRQMVGWTGYIFCGVVKSIFEIPDAENSEKIAEIRTSSCVLAHISRPTEVNASAAT